jgi:hypothetical protein
MSVSFSHLDHCCIIGTFAESALIQIKLVSCAVVVLAHVIEPARDPLDELAKKWSPPAARIRARAAWSCLSL